ncbi:HEAT repeat domain-containing protein [Actinomadura opuntiae]|uniref:HEAT repeat domain-containing protein n=1 Tax=Actinomadura sp. OS1-43 TaxID=604315 RepID=UPI00255B2784|nr:HEAT repeat domain-containing protein [Actinomadura sp. OS1-43]MDL4815025.1 HEAT repeat domain-containing protein [Actinomadura sp. OS1-43]
MSPREEGSARESHKQTVERILNAPGVLGALEAEAAKNPRVMEARRLYMAAARELLAEIQPLVPDLQKMGYQLESVGDLYQRVVFTLDEQGNVVSRRRIDYRAAVPVLVEWLPKVTYYPLADDIVRALSFGFAKKQARPVFLRLFRDPPHVEDPQFPEVASQRRKDLRVVLGQALGQFADPTMADDLIELARDRSCGEARASLVNPGLAKTKDERVPEILVDLLNDPAVASFAVQGLGRIRYLPARPQIEAALDSSDINVRDQARRALKRLDDQ